MATGPAKLTGSHGEWLISGTVGFDGALDYALSITLPREMAARLGAGGAFAAAALADENGRVLLDLRVTGNAKSPRVSWDARATRDRMLGRKPSALLAPRTVWRQWRATACRPCRATRIASGPGWSACRDGCSPAEY